MYTKDKNTRVTLRLNEAQFDYVKTAADLLGVSPSEYLRMVINLTMSADTKFTSKMKASREASEAVRLAAAESLDEAYEELSIKEDVRRENEEAHIDDII